MKIILHKSHTEPVLNGGTGTSGNGTTEQFIQSEVIDKLAERLRWDGHEVMVFNGITIPKNITGNLFLSPHCDGASPQARGYSIAVPELQAAVFKVKSEKFLDYLDKAMAKHTTIPARKAGGVFKTTLGMRQFYGFTYTMSKMPCCIVEMGFLTNAEDALIMKDTTRMANCLYDAIRNYFGQDPVMDVAFESCKKDINEYINRRLDQCKRELTH